MGLALHAGTHRTKRLIAASLFVVIAFRCLFDPPFAFFITRPGALVSSKAAPSTSSSLRASSLVTVASLDKDALVTLEVQATRHLKILASTKKFLSLLKKNVSQLAIDTGARIQIPRRGHSYALASSAAQIKVITISGDEDKVLKVLDELITLGFHEGRTTFLVPAHNAGALIGSGGQLIDEISKATGATVKLQTKDNHGGEMILSYSCNSSESLPTFVKWLFGISEYVDAMPGTVRYRYNPPEDELTSTIYIAVPEKIMGRLIGAGGNQIQNIRSLCFADIELDSKKPNGPGGNTFLVKISGLVGDVHAAHRILVGKIDKWATEMET